MSLKFKQLRKSKIKSGTEFAKKMGTDYRNVVNWEKKNGTTPSVSNIIEIAKVLDIDASEVFDAFVDNPDNTETPTNNTYTIFDKYKEPSNQIEDLFRLIQDNDYTGEGFFIYKNELFRYTNIDISPNFEIAFFSDEILNSISINSIDVISWQIIENLENLNDKSCGLSIQISSKINYFSNIDNNKSNVYTTYLNVYKKNTNNLLPYQPKPNLETVINEYDYFPSMVRDFRLNNIHPLSREELSEELKNKCNFKVSPQTISRWENGTLEPSALALKCLLDYFEISSYMFFLGKYMHDASKNTSLTLSNRKIQIPSAFSPSVLYRLEGTHLINTLNDLTDSNDFKKLTDVLLALNISHYHLYKMPVYGLVQNEFEILQINHINISKEEINFETEKNTIIINENNYKKCHLALWICGEIKFIIETDTEYLFSILSPPAMYYWNNLK